MPPPPKYNICSHIEDCDEDVDSTPGDHKFFLGKNHFGNMSCVSNMFFLKKNEKFLSRKNIIKMNHFISIFFLWKMVYFTKEILIEYLCGGCQEAEKILTRIVHQEPSVSNYFMWVSSSAISSTDWQIYSQIPENIFVSQ